MIVLSHHIFSEDILLRAELPYNNSILNIDVHLYREHGVRQKECITVDFIWSWHMIMWRLRIQKIQIGRWGGFELGPFFSLFLMRKRLFSGQKWFLRPYFPLIRGMFVFRSGLRCSFRALEVPKPRVRKKSFSLTKMTLSSLLVSWWEWGKGHFYFLKWPFPHSWVGHF